MEYFLGECKACGQTKVVNDQAFCQDCCPAHLKADKEPVTEVPCSVGLDALLEVAKDIRKSDCGAWLKDCNGIHRCSDGREKRQELMRLLDKLYKAASI